ncbi:MAG: TenA family transcriptional regulator [Porticoccaceae bacterium]
MSQFHQQLQDATVADRDYITSAPIIQQALASTITREHYAAFLLQAYHHVRHTTPLLMACGGRLDSSYEWLRNAVAEYIEEELGHQEWVLNDIEAAGFDKEIARTSTPNPATELMVSYAYDTIARINPLGFFGMVQVLEGTSVRIADAAADAIQSTTGLPNRAFSYLRSHGALDQDHVKFFADIMNKIEKPDDQQAIIHAAKMFYQLYGNVFRSIEPKQALQLERAKQ